MTCQVCSYELGSRSKCYDWHNISLLNGLYSIQKIQQDVRLILFLPHPSKYWNDYSGKNYCNCSFERVKVFLLCYCLLINLMLDTMCLSVIWNPIIKSMVELQYVPKLAGHVPTLSRHSVLVSQQSIWEQNHSSIIHF